MNSCSIQSPRGPPFASWNSHSPSHTVGELVCVTSWIQPKRWYITSKIRLSEDYGFCFEALSFCSRVCHLLWGRPDTTLWKCYLGKKWGLQSTDHGELKSTKKPSEWAWKQIFQPELSLKRDTEPETPAKPLLDSWHTETKKK